MIKSVERILSIWEERSVYSGTLIAELRNSLLKEESPPETPVEQKSMFVELLFVTLTPTVKCLDLILKHEQMS